MKIVFVARWSTEVCFVFEKNQQQIANPKQRPQQQRAQTECFSWQQKGDIVFSNLFKKKSKSRTSRKDVTKKSKRQKKAEEKRRH